MKSLDPHFRIVDRALVLNQEVVVEAAAGHRLDFADLGVEGLVGFVSARNRWVRRGRGLIWW